MPQTTENGDDRTVSFELVQPIENSSGVMCSEFMIRTTMPSSARIVFQASGPFSNVVNNVPTTRPTACGPAPPATGRTRLRLLAPVEPEAPAGLPGHHDVRARPVDPGAVVLDEDADLVAGRGLDEVLRRDADEAGVGDDPAAQDV